MIKNNKKILKNAAFWFDFDIIKVFELFINLTIKILLSYLKFIYNFILIIFNKYLIHAIFNK